MKTWTTLTENREARNLEFTTAFLIIILGIILIGPGVLHARSNLTSRPYFHIPPEMKKGDLVFAGSRIPIDRNDVKVRIEEQINYLLMDRRASLMETLERLSSAGQIINATLVEEKLPKDLLYLSATLSELTPTSKTKSGGYGWWNLGSSKHNAQVWSSSNEWDDRRDPVISTRIAAGIFGQTRTKNPKLDWLFSVAAYLDGLEKIEQIVKKNPGFSFWDVLTPNFSEIIIPRMIALKIINENRKHFDVEISPTRAMTFDTVDKQKLSRDLPLRTLAQWVGQTPREVWELNPGVDPSFGSIPKSDKRYPHATFIRTPRGSGQKVKGLMDSEGFTKN